MNDFNVESALERTLKSQNIPERIVPNPKGFYAKKASQFLAEKIRHTVLAGFQFAIASRGLLRR